MGQTTQFLRDNPEGHTEFLLERARAGSQTAWREFYQRYRTMLLVQVRSRVRGYARGHFVAEEALQNAFANAWLNVQTFEYRGEGSFRRYLTTLVLNEFHAQVKDGEGVRPILAAELAEIDGRTAREQEDQERRMERHSAMLEKLGEIEPEDREALSMYYFEGLSYERMGVILECSREKARKQCMRALERLTRKLET